MSESERRSWTTALLLSLLLGMFGADRFYLGYSSLGVLKLLTVGGLGLWYLLDLALLLAKKLPDAQGQPLG